ncbi:MAG: T9SS type A sorting domain-containing protein [Chitinophagales bacterium]|nr:T9SS type A sorting domain-containing protein [Chitinophagales bacterium]
MMFLKHSKLVSSATVVAVLLFIQVKLEFAQTPFNKVFDYENGFEFGWSVIINPDSSYSIMAGGENNFFTLGILFYHIGPNGALQYKKGYFNPLTDYYPGLSKTMKAIDNGGFFFAGASDYYYSIDVDVIVSKLDASGDTIYFRGIETGNIDGAYNHTITSDKGFAITGFTTPDYYTSTNLLIMKVDSNGNYLCSKSYGSDESDSGYTIYEISGKRLIIAGIKRYLSTNYATWIIETDSLGNVLKEKEWDSGALFCGGTSLAPGFNSKYFLEGCLDTLINLDDYPICGFVAQLDTDFSILWKTIYNDKDYKSFYIVKQLPDSTIVSVGFQTDGLSNNTRGWIAKIDKNGNQLWEHSCKFGNSTFNYFSDFEQTWDKGFIITGATNGPTSQDAWLVKLDSLGCLNPNNCFTGDLTIEISDKVEFRIAPNPASNHTNIIYNLFGKNVNAEFIITDLTGRIVNCIPVNFSENVLSLDVSQWSQGVYVCSLLIDNKKKHLARSLL